MSHSENTYIVIGDRALLPVHFGCDQGRTAINITNPMSITHFTIVKSQPEVQSQDHWPLTILSVVSGALDTFV